MKLSPPRKIFQNESSALISRRAGPQEKQASLFYYFRSRPIDFHEDRRMIAVILLRPFYIQCDFVSSQYIRAQGTPDSTLF